MTITPASGPCLLVGRAREIFDAVLLAMQAAEELGGPEHDDYLQLMDAIGEEAAVRHQNAVDNPPREDLICVGCNGSGEGHYDRTRCSSCGGSGVDEPPEEDRDDFIEPDPPEPVHNYYEPA